MNRLDPYVSGNYRLYSGRGGARYEAFRSMLDSRQTLPKGAMTVSDAERLRARADVEMVVRLDGPEEMERQGGAHRALLLIDGTLIAVTRTGEEWTQEVRRETAGRVDLLDAVMAHVSGQRPT